MKRTAKGPTTPASLAELWVEPGPERRHLLAGPAAGAPAPQVDARYDVVARDTAGFSITYKVRDEAGRGWRVKIGPEAQTEVVASRIVWALGYHQLPSYFVERWIAVDHGKGAVLGGARFRPDDDRIVSRGTWSWQQNPFVGTPPYQGLLALMMILNSTDLKNDNNELYEVAGGPRDGARRWYVVKDLGATLGETGRMDPLRGNIAAYEREPFVTGMHGGYVSFGYRGRHQELIEHITPADVRWTCTRLSRLTDAQLDEAFRAGGYAPETRARYVRRIRDKVEQGLTLERNEAKQ